ncbi:MAG: hypothetical protein ACI9QD_000544, partial [Thermoproteota archaeon]
MKQAILAFLLCITMAMPGFAQEQVNTVTLETDQESSVVVDLDKAADSIVKASKEVKTKKERKLLNKIGKMFRNLGNKRAVKASGRFLGKASALITLTTMRPFLQATNFFKGLFEKEEKNKDLETIMLFFLDNEVEFRALYRESTTLEDYAQRAEELVTSIVEDESLKIAKNLLAIMNISIDGIEEAQSMDEITEVFEGLNPEELMEIVLSADVELLTPEVFNQEIKNANLANLITPVTEEQIENFLFNQEIDFELLIDIEALIESEKKSLLIEGITSVVAQMTVAPIILSAVTAGIAGPLVAVTIAADIGVALSTKVCLKNQDKIETDKDLSKFCGFIMYRSVHKLLKSKARGYVAGKKLKRSILGHVAARKERQTQIKNCMKNKIDKKACRRAYKSERKIQIKECIESGAKKKDCRKARRESIRVNGFITHLESEESVIESGETKLHKFFRKTGEGVKSLVKNTSTSIAVKLVLRKKRKACKKAGISKKDCRKQVR